MDFGMDSRQITLNITHRSQTYSLSLEAGATLSDLQERLAELTSVPPHLQKLLYKGKKSSHSDIALHDAGITNGMKITLLGNPEGTIEALREAQKQMKRKEDIVRARESAAKPKVRSTGPPTSTSYKFHRIEPLHHLPEPSKAEDVLKRLANDPAIVHIMQEHQFSVGLLTELAPHEHPELLGLNTNAGQSIKLRLRTDRYDGFRLYSEVRRVLCHELTHNVWGDHDDNFKALNSRLNREVTEYEKHLRENTHSFFGPSYQPSNVRDEQVAEATAYVLGGTSTPSGSSMTPQQRREQVLEATLRRLQEQEREIEERCGNTRPQG